MKRICLLLLLATACGDEGPETRDDTGEAVDDTGPVPTSGPGVLPGESGLEAMCRRAFECGGTYYDDAEACIEASLDYWGDCPETRQALDAYGACVADVDCDAYDPDTYSPGAIGCGEPWDALSQC